MTKENFLKIQQQSKKLIKNNGFAWLHTFVDLGLIFLAFFLSIQSGIILWGIGQILFFACIWRCFSILHSCVHNSFFKSRSLNNFWGRFFSILALIPYSSWKDAHLKHHRYPRHRELDPSLCLPRKENITPSVRKVLDLCWKLNIPVFSFLTIFFKSGQSKDSVGLDYSFFLVIFCHLVLILFLQLTYIKIFFVPYALYLWTSDMVIISQHNLFSNIQDQALVDLKLQDHDIVTRTIHVPEVIGRYVFLNFDLHTLHHVVPNVPHYHLRKIESSCISKISMFDWYKKIRKIPGHIVYLD